MLAAWTQQHPEDGWDVSCLSSDGAASPAPKTLVLGAHHSLDDAPALDVLIHPGRPRHQADCCATRPPGLGPRAARHGSAPGLGLHRQPGLRGRRAADRPRATTHWASLNLLSELDPTVITDVDARFVDDGDLITSAGVSAGIDMALHLVARLTRRERAREVRREIQYDPQPPI